MFPINLLTADSEISAQEPICDATALSPTGDRHIGTNTSHIHALLDHDKILAR